MALHFILGGARSGKSRLAETRARDTGRPVTFIATARAGDAEMSARIAAHRSHRDPAWKTVEAPVQLAGALREHAAPGGVLVVDCLTLWLANLLLDVHASPVDVAVVKPSPLYTREHAALLEVLPGLPGEIFCVSNEIGFGVVQLGALTRFFTDEMGRLNQAVAAVAETVTLTVAGLPVKLKG